MKIFVAAFFAGVPRTFRGLRLAGEAIWGAFLLPRNFFANSRAFFFWKKERQSVRPDGAHLEDEQL